MKHLKLSARLAGEFLGLTALCLVAVGAIVYGVSRHVEMKLVQERLELMATLKSDQIEQHLSSVVSHARATFAQTERDNPAPIATIVEELRWHLETVEGLSDVRVIWLNADGSVLEPSQATLSREFVIPASGWSVEIEADWWWVPVADANQGVAIALPDTGLASILAAPTSLGTGATAFFVAEPLCERSCRAPIAGVEHWLHYEQIYGADFAIALPVATALAPTQALMRYLLISGSGLAALIVLVVIYRSRLLAEPLNAIALAATQMQTALDQNLPLPTLDLPASTIAEISTLETAFKAMAAQVGQSRQHLQRSTQDLAIDVELRTAALREAARMSESLQVIIEKVRASLNEQNILETAIYAIAQALDPVVCNVALYDTGLAHATVVYETGSLASGCLNRRLELTSDAVFAQLLGGQSIQFCPLDYTGYVSPVVKLAVPIADGDRVLGDVWVTRPANLPFLPAEQSLVTQIAAHCAIALRQARLYRAAQDQVAVLARLNRLKDDFLSTISHELRTPLTTLKMALQMMSLSPQKFDRYHPQAVSACDRQIELVNDLLNLQDLATGAYQGANSTVELTDFIAAILETQAAFATHQGHTVRLSVQPLQLCLETKPVARIIGELLRNAIKYSPPASEIVIQCFGQSDHWVCTVQNPGHIPASELHKVFDKFYRIPSNDPWKHAGTGLGLALVQQLAHYLEGEIELTSQNTFVTATLTLPYVRSIVMQQPVE